MDKLIWAYSCYWRLYKLEIRTRAIYKSHKCNIKRRKQVSERYILRMMPYLYKLLNIQNSNIWFSYIHTNKNKK